MLLGAASQRLELIIFDWIGTEWMQAVVEKWQSEERGIGLGLAEWGVVIFVSSNN